MNKKYFGLFTGLAMILGFAVAIPAFAQTTGAPSAPQGGWQGHGGFGGGMRGTMKPGVFGTVASINGDIITVTGRSGFGGQRPTTSGTTPVAPTAPTPVTYTVDATNAVVKKNNATSTLSAIVVGDTVMAQGTLTGTNLVATMIRDGVVPTMMRGGQNGGGQNHATSTPAFTGNGEPMTAGNVTAVNGKVSPSRTKAM